MITGKAATQARKSLDFSVHLSGTSIKRRTKQRDWQCVPNNEVSLRGGSFPFTVLLLAGIISFVIPRISLLYRGSLNRAGFHCITPFHARDSERKYTKKAFLTIYVAFNK